MTAKTEAAKPASAGAKALGNLIGSLAGTALIVWTAGVALHQGFGVSVPFTAAWLLFLAGLGAAKMVTDEVAASWHDRRVKADITLLAASMAFQESLTLKSFEKRVKDVSEKVDSGAYL